MDTYDEIQEKLESLLSDTDDLQYTMASLLDLKRTDLIELCKKNELASYGTKQQLAERLIEEFGGDSVLQATSNLVIFQEERDEDGEVIGKGERV